MAVTAEDRKRGTGGAELPGSVPVLEAPARTVTPQAEPWQSLKASLQHDRQQWLIRLRWIAIVGVLVTSAIASFFDWVRSPLQLLGVTAFMAFYNTVALRRWNLNQGQRSPRYEENAVFLPILFDLASLTMLLHWSGGIENPFALFFVFHMAIGATLLPTPRAYVLAGTAALLWGGTVLLEHSGVLMHHSLYLGMEPHFAFTRTGTSPLALFGYLTAFGLMLFGVVYFVRSVEHGRWQAEAKALERERLALARDKMARVGEISAGVAHTVRNPLQGLMTSLDLLRDSYLIEDPSADELADIMDQGLQRVERVTRRLLTLTRERSLSFKPTDINHLIREFIGFLGPKATDAGVSINLDLHDVPEAMLDPDAIGDALINLVDNAVQACSRGDQIQISSTALSGSAEGVAITICDTGPGIPEELRGRVFEPFFTSKAVGEGSGLGLAIAREVIEDHQGRLCLINDPNWSTCFEVLLPRVAGEGLA